MASRPAVGAPPLEPSATTHGTAPLSTEVHGSGPGGLATAVNVGATAPPPPAAGAASVAMTGSAQAVDCLPPGSPRRAEFPRVRAHAGPEGGGRRLRTLRRRRVPWGELSRERLAAAWSRVQIEHAAEGELLLVGVFGPVPIDAIASLALEPDGRLALVFTRRGSGGRLGDVALARPKASGRLLRSDIPHPVAG